MPRKSLAVVKIVADAKHAAIVNVARHKKASANVKLAANAKVAAMDR